MREERFIDSAIRKALRCRTGSAASSCPDENTLAAYLERNLSDQERLHLESHFSDCTSCRELLALAMRIVEDEPAALEDTVRRSPEPRLHFPSRLPLALVAALVLGIGTAVVFLLTSESTKPGKVEVAEQRVPAAAPAAENMPAQPRGSAAEQPKPSQPAAPGVASVQADRERADVDRMSPAREGEGHAQEAPSPPVYPSLFESKREASNTGRVARNEAPSSYEPKDESKASIADTLRTGGAVGASVGGNTGGAEVIRKPAEERAAEEVRPQAAAVAVDSRGVRSEVRSEPARLTVESQRPVPSSASVHEEEARWRDILYRAAADEKQGKALHSATSAIGDRTFKLFGGCWIDLKVLESPEAGLVECSPASADSEEIRKSLPAIEGLVNTGLPILVNWKGRICVIR